MNPFRSIGAPCISRQEGRHIIFENKYQLWSHDLDKGGELTEARVKNGSDRSLITKSQRCSIGLIEGSGYHLYSTDLCPAEKYELEQEEAGPCLRIRQRLADEQGRFLPGVTIEHKTLYHEWGYAEHRLCFNVETKVDNLGQVQVGSFFASPELDCAVLRENLVRSTNPKACNPGIWKFMSGGRSRWDAPVYMSHNLPLSATLFKRGLEGIEFALDDHLESWDNLVVSKLHWQLCYLSYCQEQNAYEIRFSPLDVLQEGQYIEPGKHALGFRMTMPFIKRDIVPLRPCSGQVFKQDCGFAGRWPDKSDICNWRNAGVTLMRLHNDGDAFDNGIFWRDGGYPPYPPEEMKKMDAFLSECNQQKINVVPYFSVKEFHPAVKDYKENAEKWGRKTTPDAPLLKNRFRNDFYGTQMCLESAWAEKRKDSIDIVLKNHPFNGVYYDWCAGGECNNPAHAQGRHWDNDKLQQHLEWSHKRTAPEGEVYLHLTGTPSMAAENLASLVLTEESGYAKLTPEMFTPHVHYMNIAPRQICDMMPGDASPTQRRRLAFAALLHHATISSVNPVYLKLYEEIETLRNEVTHYRRHTAPGEGVIHCNNEQAGASLYWNDTEVMMLIVNFSEERITTSWKISSALPVESKQGTVTLEPLELKIVKFPMAFSR